MALFRRKRKCECPLNAEEQAWLEDLWLWLTNRFGAEALSAAAVLDPAELYACRHDPIESVVDDMTRQLAPALGMDARHVSVGFYDDPRPEARADLDDESDRLREQGHIRVWLDVQCLADPQTAFVFLLRELAMVLLDEQDEAELGVDNLDATAELLGVYAGLGVPLANASVYDEGWSAGTMVGWQVGRRTAISLFGLSYALALFAHLRGEHDPDWAAGLRPDAVDVLRQAMRYLETARDRD